MGNGAMDKLMKTARDTFINELGYRVKEIDNMLIECGDRCGEDQAQNIVAFFHRLNGTGATLGLIDLASVGGKWEMELGELLKRQGFLDGAVLRAIQAEIIKTKLYLDGMATHSAVDTPDTLAVDDSDTPGRGKTGKIMLVDDDVTILMLLENALTMEGHTVYICDDPAAVMDIMATVRPDVIMLDIMMPKINGFQLLEEIKTKSEHAQTHVVFLSAIDNVDDKIKAMKSGADDYITKPFIIDEVITRIELFLKR